MVEYGPETPFTAADLIALIRRNFPSHWIDTLLEQPASRSLFDAMVAVMLRVQEVLDENFGRGAFILTAPGPAPATSVVRLQRPSGSAVTLGVNVRFQDHRGAIWRAVEETEIAASVGAQTVDIPIRTDRVGHFLNSFEPLTYIALDALPDVNLVVVLGPSPAENGRAAILDLHGRERDLPKAPGESDDQYRQRMVLIPDAVAPRALSEVIIAVLDAFPATRFIADMIVQDGLRALRESSAADFALSSLRGTIATPAAFWDDITFFDDTHGHVMRDLPDATAWFDVLLPAIPEPEDNRLFLDSGYYDDPLSGFTDLSLTLLIETAIAAIADELYRRSGQLVRFQIIVGGNVPLLRYPTAIVQAGDWTAAGDGAPSTILTATAQYDGNHSYMRSVQGRSNGAAFVVAGDSLMTIPAPVAATPVSISHVVIRAHARRDGPGSGVQPQLAFIVNSTGSGTSRALVGGYPVTIDHSDWRPYSLILEQNPLTLSAWTLSDIAGLFGIGVANTAAVGATEALLVSELYVEFWVSYGA